MAISKGAFGVSFCDNMIKLLNSIWNAVIRFLRVL